jgi:RNA polymerase primary sigma factor
MVSPLKGGGTMKTKERVAQRATTLTDLLSLGQEKGVLHAKQIEASIFHAVPDASEFSLFLDLTRTLNISIRERPEVKRATQPANLSALNVYFRDVGRHRLLTAQEERKVGRMAREGDERARELMVLSNLRLVVSLARRYVGRGLDLEDLIEEGNLGLLTAVQRFDPEKGFRFSTYAAWWIRLGIAKGLAEHSRTLKIPLHVMRSLHKYIETERRLTLELGRFPEPEEIAKGAGFGPRRARTVATLVQGIKSLDETAVGEAGRGLTLLERIPDTPSLSDLLHRQMECSHLEDLMRQLSERENLVLRIRYGLMDGTPRSLTRTGLFLGVSRERVRQIERRALLRLREWIEGEERRGMETLKRVGAGVWSS